MCRGAGKGLYRRTQAPAPQAEHQLLDGAGGTRNPAPRLPKKATCSHARPRCRLLPEGRGHGECGGLGTQGDAGWRSLLLLASGDGDQLLGGLGDVVGTLDDLLGQELVVHGGAGLGGHGLAALALQAVGAGVEQPQGAPHRLQGWFLGQSTGPVSEPMLRGLTVSAGDHTHPRDTPPLLP